MSHDRPLQLVKGCGSSTAELIRQRCIRQVNHATRANPAPREQLFDVAWVGVRKLMVLQRRQAALHKRGVPLVARLQWRRAESAAHCVGCLKMAAANAGGGGRARRRALTWAPARRVTSSATRRCFSATNCWPKSDSAPLSWLSIAQVVTDRRFRLPYLTTWIVQTNPRSLQVLPRSAEAEQLTLLRRAGPPK